MDFYEGTYVELLSGENGYIRNILGGDREVTLTIEVLTPECLKGQDIVVTVTDQRCFPRYFAQLGCKRWRTDKIEPVHLGFVNEAEDKLRMKVNELVEAINKINEQLAKER